MKLKIESDAYGLPYNYEWRLLSQKARPVMDGKRCTDGE